MEISPPDIVSATTTSIVFNFPDVDTGGADTAQVAITLTDTEGLSDTVVVTFRAVGPPIVTGVVPSSGSAGDTANVVGASFASLGSAWAVAGVHADAWAPAFFRTVDNSDIRGLLLKSALSGFLVAVLTFHLGTGPKRSGDDVGRSVNSSIVIGMFTVLVVHSILTFLQFS